MKEAKTGYPVVEAYAIKYSVNITAQEMLKILDWDRENFMDSNQLFDKLKRLPYITEVDYEGMWGPYIYLELPKDQDTNEHWVEILKIITDYIKGGHNE